MTNRWVRFVSKRCPIWCVGLVFLTLAAGTLDASSLFLHNDSAHQHTTAIDLATNACWGTGGKPMVSLMLAVPYALLGVDPHWEMVLLSLLAALGIMALASTMAEVTGSRRWAVLGALWFISLPSLLYFTRYHIGFPLAFFMLGLWLHTRERYTWAGVAFGMAITSHANFSVPVIAFLGWSELLRLLRKEPGRIRAAAQTIVGGLVPVLVIVAVYFLFFNQPLGWLRGTFGTIDRLSDQNAVGTTWTHLWQVVRVPNGWLNATLLLIGLAYPTVRKPDGRVMDGIYLAGWSVVAAYTVYLGVRHAIFVARMLAGVYPLLVISSTYTIGQLAQRVNGHIPTKIRLTAGSVVAVGLSVATINHALDAATGSRTAYDEVARAMTDAGASGLPVRYFGNPHVASAFSLLYGVETSINESSPAVIAGDTRAVLIFELESGERSGTLEALRADGRVDPTDYVIWSYPHLRSYLPALTSGRHSTMHLRRLATQPNAREIGAATGEIQIWWPREPRGTFQAQQVVDRTTNDYILYYSGSGCNSARRYGHGTQNYYDVLIQKGLEFTGLR